MKILICGTLATSSQTIYLFGAAEQAGLALLPGHILGSISGLA
jgi:hypothetical protein